MEKEYYTLTELTERWDFCLHDALYLAENNICRFWINLPESDAIRFRKESNNGLTYDLPLENCQAKGLLLLTTEDVRRIIIYKTANVIQLPCQDDMTVFVRLKTVRELTIDDVLILCKDKLRLEKELGFFDKKAKVKSILWTQGWLKLKVLISVIILMTFSLKNCRTDIQNSATMERAMFMALYSRKLLNNCMMPQKTGGFGFMVKPC